MLRGFTDSTGVEWRVWEVFPSKAGTAEGADAFSRTSLKETPFANGWLCFECRNAKRRLAPIPQGWEASSGKALEDLCLSATAVDLNRRGRSKSDTAPESPLTPTASSPG